MTTYDVMIIGTGAGGATLAYALAQSGKKVLILERGEFLPRESDNSNPKAVFVDEKYTADELWLDKDGKEFSPGIHYYVGGNTKMYGAALLRFRWEDFEEVHHHGGISPAWPLSYEDFEPYYTMAERLYSVHGEAGIDPTEPPRSAPYPYPPLKHEPRIQQLYDDLVRYGHRPFPLPMAVRLGENNDQSHEDYHIGPFDGFPDSTGVKADAEVTAINPILERDNVTLKIGCYAQKLVTDPSGRRVTEVHVLCAGKTKVYKADVVVVACGAINSAALLLRSACGRYPDGLANSSGLVGRHYMCHNNSALLAVSRDPSPTRFGKTWGLNDFYSGSDDWEYPLGHIQMMGKTDAEMLKAEAPSFAPGMALDYLADHSIDLWLTSEDLPDPDNRVTVDKDGRIRLHYQPNNMESHRRLIAKMKGLLEHLGCEKHLFPRNVYFRKRVPLAGTAHQCGTLRFGRDSRTSVLDMNCKAHDLDNLYVVDASFFASNTAINPALTIMANALRVGEHLSRM